MADGYSSNNSTTDIDFNELSYSKAFGNRVNARRVLNEADLSRCFRVSVEGHDKNLSEDDIRAVYSWFFSSCGKICDVIIPTDPQTGLLKRRGFVYFRDRDAQKKAVALSRRNVGFPFPAVDDELGGWAVVVKAAPKLPCKYTSDEVDAAHRLTHSSYCGFCVKGYPTALPAEDVKRALFRHFSSCGKIVYLTVDEDRSQPGHLKRAAFVSLSGQGALEKAVALNGTEVGLDGTVLGKWKVTVVTLPPPGTPPFPATNEHSIVQPLRIGWEGPIGHRWIDLHPSAATSS